MLVKLKDIFGQDDAIESIRRAYLSDRLPHGLIFAGPVGVGKATTAAALGALFLCESPKSDSPCGKCASCKLSENNSHPDYHVITKELIRQHDKTGKSKGIELSINVIRPELLDKAAMTPAMNRGKVFVIEQAELMNPAAQNSMLKTLEEPPGRTLIILLTDQPGLLLPTVRSRSQLIRFGRLDAKVVREQLVERGIDKNSADRATAISDGSLGQAINWLHDGVVEGVEDLIGRLQQIEKRGQANDLADFIRKSADAYATKQLERDELASKDQFTREGIALYLKHASEYFRKRLAEIDDDEQLDRCCNAIDAIAQAEINLDSNVTVALLLNQLALSLERVAAPVPAGQSA